MNEKISIPEKIVVGQVKRDDTYTGKLAYIIYIDEKGVLRKEKSWEGWRDENIPSETYENKPTEGFVLNRHGGGKHSGYYSDDRNAFIRVFDPRGYEFEISLENLLFILKYADCSRGKGLEGKFIYGWLGKDLVLIPENCEEYKKSLEFTALKTQKISSKDLIKGHTYLTKNQETIVYLGKYNYIKHTNYDPKQSISYVFYNIKDKYRDDVYSNMMDKTFITIDINKIAKSINDNVIPNFADIIEQFENSQYVLYTKNLTITKTNIYDIPLLKSGDYYHNNTTIICIKTSDNVFDCVEIHPLFDYYQKCPKDTHPYTQTDKFRLSYKYTLTIKDNDVEIYLRKDKEYKISDIDFRINQYSYTTKEKLLSLDIYHITQNNKFLPYL